MAQLFWVHPDDPQPRLLKKAAGMVQAGGVIAYPTDAGFALGCGIGQHDAVQRLREIRRLGEKHHFTLLCRSLAEASQYAKFDNAAFRLVKRLIPGPYTFVLPATREVPRKLQSAKRQTIGIRIPNHPIVQGLLENIEGALLSTTLWLPGEELPEQEGWVIQEKLEGLIDAVLDDGSGGDTTPTTVIDCCGETPVVLREGKGPVDIL